MKKGRVSDCILPSSHVIPVPSARATWRVPRLVCVSPPKNPHSLHIAHTSGSMSEWRFLRQWVLDAADLISAEQLLESLNH
jgi:hypothetical protein